MPRRHPKNRTKRTRDWERHTCNYPGCMRQVANPHWGCRPHEEMIPRSLLRRVYDSYVPGQEYRLSASFSYLVAQAWVEAWVWDNHPDAFL